jgi:hypothetical protein
VIRKAIIIAGVEEDQEDQEYSGLTGDVIDTNASRAFSALCAQDYSDSDDIYFMSSSQTAIEGVERVNPSYETLEAHLDQLTHHISTNESLDLVIYLIGAGDSDAFKMSNTETLTTSQLSGLLDSLTRPPESLPVGTRVTIIYDGDKSGSFIAPLASSAGSERIIITSASEDGPAYFNSAGDICFSFFFWSQIANGATVYKAFAYARQAITYLSLNKEISFSCYPLHLPLIDADRDGTANEADDYAIARARSIGLGTKFAADTPPVKPTIGSASVEEVGGEITISAENITPAGQIQRVWAIVKPIAYCPGHSGEKTQELEEVDLEFRDGGNWIYNGPSPFAGHTYKVSVYAMDTDRNTSDPKEAKAYHPGGDIYEDPDGNGIYDDDPSQANVIVVNHPTPQPHTFHTFNGVCDRDWVKFYGVEGQNYTIEADNLVNPYPIDIKIYRGSELSFIVHNQMLPDEGSASYPFSCPGDGIYYVMLSSSEACSSDETMSYDLKVYDNNLGLPVHVTGTVRNSVTGDGIDGAVIKSLRGVGRGISVNGEYQFYEYPGNYTITATKNGYAMTQRNIAIESEDVYVRQDITMHPQSTEECTADADCDDDLFCNGTETCADGTCQPGPDSCADDGLFCNGQETCNEENDSCGHAGDPCPANLKCDEEVDACVGCLQDADCPDDGLFCTGTQTCVDRTCQPGTNPCPDGVECDEETDQCLFPALAVTPQIIMQSHWMPLPVFMSIRGTNIHFTGQKDIIFNPPSVIGLPLLINQQTLLYMGLMMPTWITRQPGDSIEVTVTAGAKQATGSVNVMLLPFMLKEESR